MSWKFCFLHGSVYENSFWETKEATNRVVFYGKHITMRAVGRSALCLQVCMPLWGIHGVIAVHSFALVPHILECLYLQSQIT